MTTNYLTRLDHAIYRKGRVDLLLELDPPEHDSIQKMFEYYYGKITIEADDLAKMSKQLPTCEYTNAILHNLEDPNNAISELVGLIDKKMKS